MKLELGQFYLFGGRGDTVLLFTEFLHDGYYKGHAWQNGMIHNIHIQESNQHIKEFIPIDSAIAKMVQSTQAIDTEVT